jgi:hypothetical protein
VKRWGSAGEDVRTRRVRFDFSGHRSEQGTTKFSLRFKQAGSLYHSSTPDNLFVGPIISTPFYRALDDFVRIDHASLLSALNRFRGPFGTVSVSSWIRAELYILSQNPSTLLSELDGNHERLQ